MKKTNNKGFSLVELIIVIAIMAILAGAIAPALIRYIDKSRRSNDVSAAKSIKTAVETAIGNEKIYELLVPKAAAGGATATPTVFYLAAGDDAAAIATAIGNPNGLTTTDLPDLTTVQENASIEIADSLGGKAPKVKFNKWGQDCFAVAIDNRGNVKVYVSAGSSVTDAVAALASDEAGYATDDTKAHTGKYWLLTPEVNDYYQ